MPREYKLVYFNSKCKGETARMMFKMADQPFKDIRINSDDWQEYKSKTPMGFLPYLDVDGVIIAQSNAINRFLADELGFNGRTTFERARIDMIADSIEDIFGAVRPTYKESDPEKKKLGQEKFYKETYLPYLSILQHILEENNGGNGYFVGDTLTWADLTVVNMLEFYGQKVVTGSDAFWEDFPKLKAHRMRVESEPKIAAWIKERPVTER